MKAKLEKMYIIEILNDLHRRGFAPEGTGACADCYHAPRHQAVLDSPPRMRALESFKKHNLLTFKPGENSNG